MEAMERKASLLPLFRNKNAPKAPDGGVSRVGYQLVRMRSPVQIWIAAPIKSTQTVKFECFLLFYCNFLDKSVIMPKSSEGKKPTQKPTPTRKNRPDRGLSLPGFLYGLSHDLGGLADALLVCMGVHSQRYGLVTVAQGLAD